MCGITACFSPKNAVSKAMVCLKKLEYRGYDSFGFAWKQGTEIHIQKFVGKIDNAWLHEFPESSVAIAQTRWATHGSVTKEN
ncbi:MAG: glutamine--fructose-6-phosphate aminotransferase, partial [Candidatus Diapherotrites archaeon]|nr:glutamine--fructose-6-phosphate aminotransferase [Candidatus Diapherotrites archaeon]